jgi:hypothetical protein
MFARYLAKAVMTSLALLLLPAATPPPVPVCPRNLAALYSPHALRRIRILLQLEMLRARRRRLAAAQAVIEHRMSIDEYLAQNTPAPAPDQGTLLAVLKQSNRLRTITCR